MSPKKGHPMYGGTCSRVDDDDDVFKIDGIIIFYASSLHLLSAFIINVVGIKLML